MNLLIKSATIVDKASKYNGKKVDILIEKGTISKIRSKIDNPANFKEFKRDNLHVSLGWFDSSVSFGEPGYEERETLENGLKTAALSGFTDIVLNPNTNPVIDSATDVSYIKTTTSSNAVRIHPLGSLTKGSKGVDLAELYDMKKSGAVGFYDYKKSISNANLVKIAIQYSQTCDTLVCMFSEDEKIKGSGVANEDVSSTHLGLKGIAPLAEEIQIARNIYLTEYTGGKLHLPTISTDGSVAQIKNAKKSGIDVSCSVAIHNLFLDDSMLDQFDGNLRVSPPLRTIKNNKVLIKAVKDSVIDMVTSDHSPIDIEDKKVAFEHAKNGTIGLESAFGALNSLFDTELAVELLIKGRERFKIESPSIGEGVEANLTFFNPDTAYTFSEDHIHSTSKNSAFLGQELKGSVYGIFSNNKLVTNQ
ncbi:dihydroorotase [Spongiivirga citrea]|uniref:Dihydroorotase n=1 Tax=Spongiivirga citrea TaxID=1481457 RepID=A0A6M0CF71_9FLAO|nr:dihydroorotase [Spongiivirga citrea]NER16498.1 dihydroorotase [Spongiivirga citrea]